MDLHPSKSAGSTTGTICLLNIRSVKNKITALTDFILENNFDIIALTETWLSDADAVTLGDLTPAGYSSPRIAQEKKERWRCYLVQIGADSNQVYSCGG